MTEPDDKGGKGDKKDVMRELSRLEVVTDQLAALIEEARRGVAEIRRRTGEHPIEPDPAAGDG